MSPSPTLTELFGCIDRVNTRTSAPRPSSSSPCGMCPAGWASLVRRRPCLASARGSPAGPRRCHRHLGRRAGLPQAAGRYFRPSRRSTPRRTSPQGNPRPPGLTAHPGTAPLSPWGPLSMHTRCAPSMVAIQTDCHDQFAARHKLCRAVPQLVSALYAQRPFCMQLCILTCNLYM